MSFNDWAGPDEDQEKEDDIAASEQQQEGDLAAEEQAEIEGDNE